MTLVHNSVTDKKKVHHQNSRCRLERRENTRQGFLKRYSFLVTRRATIYCFLSGITKMSLHPIWCDLFVEKLIFSWFTRTYYITSSCFESTWEESWNIVKKLMGFFWDHMSDIFLHFFLESLSPPTLFNVATLQLFPKYSLYLLMQCGLFFPVCHISGKTFWGIILKILFFISCHLNSANIFGEF